MQSCARLIKTNTTQNILKQLQQNTFAHIQSKFYLDNYQDKLKSLQQSYTLLKSDPTAGNRLRAYSRFNWSPAQNTLLKNQDNGYFQSPEYNYADGGKIRRFEPICEKFLTNPLIESLLAQNIKIAKETDIVKFDQSLEIGLHQIRYKAFWDQPAYSSPMWLHRDDEPLVFVHLLNLTYNVVGGDNIIAPHAKEVDCVIRLNEPLETILLTKKKLHAVTPMGSSTADAAYRDILLVTFQNNPPRPLATPKASANGLFAKKPALALEDKSEQTKANSPATNRG